jgi:leucine-zipper of insertion element IS481
MRLHGIAALTPRQRLRPARRVVDEGWTLAGAAEVSERTASTWVRRYREEGDAGLVDRGSAPRRQPSATRVDRVEAIAALRRVWMDRPGDRRVLGMAVSTVQESSPGSGSASPPGWSRSSLRTATSATGPAS